MKFFEICNEKYTVYVLRRAIHSLFTSNNILLKNVSKLNPDSNGTL